MREDEFRHRLLRALGEPPRLAEPVLGRPAQAQRRPYPVVTGFVAVALAIVLIVVLVSTRAFLHPQGALLPASRPSAGATPTFPCALPVVVTMELGNPGQDPVLVTENGFVNLPGGTYSSDPNVVVSDLPAAPDAVPGTYSAQLGRWLPAWPLQLSPDGLSYVYVKLQPAGSTYSDFRTAELHLVDAKRKTERVLWTSSDALVLVAWTSATGLIVSTTPKQGGTLLLWRVDPNTGGAVRAPDDADPTLLPSSALPPAGNVNYWSVGMDAQGRNVFWLGSRTTGTRYRIARMESGRLTDIYSGTIGDGTDFEPAGMYGDAQALWFGNFDGSRVWEWTAARGLKSFGVTGIPFAPSGYQQSYVSFGPAGPCVPGVFTGVRPSPLPPAATPSPSPVPSPVDWSGFLARPLRMPQVSGGSCPVSSQVDIAVKARYGKWPVYGFGPGPTYASGQLTWYSNGPQAILLLTDPRYTGPVLARTRRLDGAGDLVLAGDGDIVGDGALGLRQTSSPPYWGTWLGTVTPSTPGCYGIQLDGKDFTAVVVISVTQGPPPPG